MIPSTFEYHSPTSLDEAISLLGSLGDDAKLLAGGHSLLPLMKLRLATPSVLIDVVSRWLQRSNRLHLRPPLPTSSQGCRT